MQNFEKARRFFNGLALVQKLKLTSLSLVLLSPLLTIAQTPTKPLVNATISGQVIDSRTSDPLPGALVQLEGVTHSVQTDRDGKFSFVTGQKLPVTLIVSYLGYDKSSVVVTNTPITIKLNQNQKQLSEILIVGYGTQNKKEITGSVAKIKASEVIQQPVASFDAQLQGKAAGVQVITNSGVPGEGIFLRVRGTTSINSSSDPLYIVDGVFLNNSSLQATNLGGRVTSPLADINPADIESIEVLKDASATAIYGSRGANGVVLITTKKGNYNNKSTVSFNIANGWVQADKNTVPSLTTGPEAALLANEWWINSGVDNPSLNQTVQNRPFRPVSEGGRGLPEEQPTYDRLGDLLRKGRVQDYSLAVQGGSNSSRYYIGAGYTDQEALIKVIKFSRASLKFNFDQKLSEKVSIGLTNSFSKSDRNQARTGDGPQVSLWNSAVSTATFTPKYGEDGFATGVDNTYTLIDNYDVKTQSLRYVGSVFAEAELAKGLKFKTSFSLDYNNYKESAYWNTNTSIGKAVGGQANSDITQNNTWINEQTLTYQKQLGNHKLTLLAGNSFQSNTLSVNSGVGTGFANDNYKLISSASIRTASEGWTGYNLSSFFGRAGYNYLSKYFAEATLRADGSSKFGTNNQWGYFPAFSLGWRLKEESYLTNVDWLSDLKLRASYGITGNQSGIDNFASRGLWSGGSSYADLVGSPLPGIGPEQLGNDDLRWEKTKQTDIGLDASFFNNRLAVTLDLYHKYTSDLLLQQPIPSSTGFSVYWANVGEISNKGYELTINSTNLRTRHFTWSTDFNISGNKNKIEKLPSPITQYTRDWVILKEGYSMNSFWLYNQLYVDPNTGAPVFEGQDANGNVTAEDRKIIHSAYPKFYGGLTNNFKYKNFDLGVAFSFQYGNYTLNLQRYFKERNASAGSVTTNVLNRWQKKGDITDIPRLTSVGSNYTIDQSSRYLEDASFLRLKQVTLGYNLPKSTFSKLGLSDVRVYFVGSNLFLWTKYTGDPESGITSNPNAQGLGGFGTPPQPKGFQFGLNVKL
ncbi:SusC/RagA family TonB-linked outer membrane protein [Pedobacter hiemivivus]|uniref:TonB-dependent receptor n=1 Tax=Pedobacter hiemivivus TaxID=2530454 RepID=A0A4R0N8S3_9SPHI|nr:TonB-dependent receptor [Pedobacter hiemivivus]TCC95753.1 TonB-dependent receptor [Pedobacter hiemivivus]